LAGRIEHFSRLEGGLEKDAERFFFLLREALYRGEFVRGEAGRVIGSAERKGRSVLTKAIEAGLLKSDTPSQRCSWPCLQRCWGLISRSFFRSGNWSGSLIINGLWKFSTDGSQPRRGEAVRMIQYQFSPDDHEEIRQLLSLLSGDPDMEALVISDLFSRYGIGLCEAQQLIEEDR
jgi:hypothetical protein